MRLAIKIWGFRCVHAWFWRRTPLPEKRRSTPSNFDIINLGSLVNAAANRSPIHTNCLQRSLTLWWLLRRIGVTSDLRIGVDRQKDALKAHAWLEKDGIVINDNLESVVRFAAFDQIIEPVTAETVDML